MDKTLLSGLCGSLNKLGGMIPAVPCPELFELLEELFTEEEAEIAAQMPPTALSVEDLAQKLERPVAEILPVLETMADKATVLTREKDSVVLYRLLAIMPGMFEFQFMRGTTSTRDRRLALKFKNYLELAEPMVTKTLSGTASADTRPG